MTADAAIRIVLSPLQGCKLHTHDHQLPPGLATVQELTARMFTTTLRSQPVYSGSRLSEVDPARESGRINDTDSDNVGNRHPSREDGFTVSQIHPHIYMMQPFIHSFSMHMPNGKPELM